MPQGIFLNPADIEVLNGVKYAQAWNIYKAIREHFNKPKGKKITVEDYAAFEMVPVELVRQKLNIP